MPGLAGFVWATARLPLLLGLLAPPLPAPALASPGSGGQPALAVQAEPEATATPAPAGDQAPTITLTVSAAADLGPAFTEIGQAFTRETGIGVVLNFGGSGQLAQQIAHGAPVDLFASANVGYVEEVKQLDLIIPETERIYARGRITLWTRADSPLQIERIEDLARPEVRQIAIANPDRAPYGVAAREALQSAGIWDAVQPKLVLGENIAQTLQYAESGNVDVAIVAYSLSLSSNGRWVLIPEELHQPINQALAVIRTTQNEDAARQLADFITGPVGRPIMERYGFELPEEEAPQE